jgi:hypothetical protein
MLLRGTAMWLGCICNAAMWEVHCSSPITRHLVPDALRPRIHTAQVTGCTLALLLSRPRLRGWRLKSSWWARTRPLTRHAWRAGAAWRGQRWCTRCGAEQRSSMRLTTGLCICCSAGGGSFRLLGWVSTGATWGSGGGPAAAPGGAQHVQQH